MVAAFASDAQRVEFLFERYQQLTSLLLVIIGVLLIIDGKLSVGALVAANMLAGRVLAPIAGIASVITRGTQTIINQVQAMKRMVLFVPLSLKMRASSKTMAVPPALSSAPGVATL